MGFLTAVLSAGFSAGASAARVAVVIPPAIATSRLRTIIFLVWGVMVMWVMFGVAVARDPRLHIAAGTNQFNCFVNIDFTTGSLIGISLTEVRRKRTACY